MRRNVRNFMIACLMVLLPTAHAQGQDAEKSTAAKAGGGDLRSAVQNPIS